MGTKLKQILTVQFLPLQMRLGQVYAWFIEYRFSGGNTSKRRCFDIKKNVWKSLFFVDKLIDMEQNNALWSA
jgi:hypothetical protein